MSFELFYDHLADLAKSGISPATIQAARHTIQEAMREIAFP